jgi:hypothetical protein
MAFNKNCDGRIRSGLVGQSVMNSKTKAVYAATPDDLLGMKMLACLDAPVNKKWIASDKSWISDEARAEARRLKNERVAILPECL